MLHCMLSADVYSRIYDPGEGSNGVCVSKNTKHGQAFTEPELTSFGQECAVGLCRTVGLATLGFSGF